MLATEILTALQEVGATARVNGDKLLVEPGNRVPAELVPEIREHKLEIMELVSIPETELPFPIGIGGQPRAQVEAAETVMAQWGITDPVLRKYNVLSWVRGHYQDRGENHGEHYEALKAEQIRLGRILDPDGDP